MVYLLVFSSEVLEGSGGSVLEAGICFGDGFEGFDVACLADLAAGGDAVKTKAWIGGFAGGKGSFYCIPVEGLTPSKSMSVIWDWYLPTPFIW